MEREIRDELEVPGHVVLIKNMTRDEGIARMREIIDKYEKQGKNKLSEIPEGLDKQELRDLFTAFGQNVKF